MNWSHLRRAPWLDTRARFVAGTPPGGKLLDLGSSDGETLRHFAELRPDLSFFAADIAGASDGYPRGCQFVRADLRCARLPWADATMDAITCMHLVEHLEDPQHVCQEAARLLKSGGRVYFETPHPKTVTYSSPRGAAADSFTMNFYDDPTHVRPVSVGALAKFCRKEGLAPLASGTSRNWLFAAAWLLYWWAAPSRKRFTARAHWLGWSAYLIASKPA